MVDITMVCAHLTIMYMAIINENGTCPLHNSMKEKCDNTEKASTITLCIHLYYMIVWMRYKSDGYVMPCNENKFFFGVCLSAVVTVSLLSCFG